MKSAAGDAILLGTAKQEINPPPGYGWVQYPRQRPYTGAESDLYVRAMVYGDPATGKPASALAVLDSLYVHAEFAAEVRRRVSAEIPDLPPRAVMLAATHTHSGLPLRAFDMGGGGWAGRVVLERAKPSAPPPDTFARPAPEYIEKVQAAAASAIAAAWRGRRPVRGRIGLAEARLGHSRRVVAPDGVASNEWTDPQGKHTGYFSPAIRFVVFEDASTGKPRAILVGYGCHPVAVGPEAAKPSADYPGYCVRRLEELTGAELALHVTTGGADINPRLGLLPDGQGARAMGEALAEAVGAALGGARPLGLSPLRSAAVPMELKVRPVLDRGPRDLLAGRVRPGEAPCVASEVQAIRLGELALVSAPGELFAQLVTCVENLSPFAHTIVVGHANDALGYLYTEAAGREGGYEVIHGACSDSTERPFLAAAHSALDLCGPAQA